MKSVLFDPPAAGLAAYFKARSAVGEDAEQTNCSDLLRSILGPVGRVDNPHLNFSKQNVALKLLFDPDDLIEITPPCLNLNLEFESLHEIEISWMLKTLDQLISDPIRRAEVGLDLFRLRNDGNYRTQIASQIYSIYQDQQENPGSSDFDQIKAVETIKKCLDGYYDAQAIEQAVVSHDATLFTPHGLLTQARSISVRELRTSDILPVLAMSGLQIVLPALGTIDPDAIPDIREALEEERQSYLAHLRTVVPECFAGLVSGDFADVAQYADIQLKNHLHVRLLELERAAEKKGPNFAKKTGLRLLDATPSLFGSAARGEVLSVAVSALEFIVETITGRASELSPGAEFEDVCYLYGLKQKASA